MRSLDAVSKTLALLSRLIAVAEEHSDPLRRKEALLAVLDEAAAAGHLGEWEWPGCGEPSASDTQALDAGAQAVSPGAA